MVNLCEQCGRHSSSTVYDMVSQQEWCLWCVMSGIRHRNDHDHGPRTVSVDTARQAA